MCQPTQFVGLDVHADSISIAVAEEGRERAKFLARIPNDIQKLLKRLEKLGTADSMLCCYEAGPTGYALQRELSRRGFECQVIAPSKIPRKSGERVKTDRLDSERLAHYLRSGDLVPVRVPDEACEAMRDLLRARNAAKRAQLAARHQLSKFLLRHGRRWPRSNWTKLHFEWIEKQRFDHPAQNRVIEECLQAVNDATARITRYEQLLAELVPSTEQAQLVEALQAFRGIQLLTASSIAFELGDLRRFKSAKQLMSYVGLVPSEDSSGERVKKGAITRAGNKGLRRLMIEASWAYRHYPREDYRLKKRAERVAPGVRSIAFQAQVRLHARYRKMINRGKTPQTVLVAVARELMGFIWAVGQEEQLITT